MLMSVSAPTFASTPTAPITIAVPAWKLFATPAQLIMKQTITFKDGNTVTIYFHKDKQLCKLYSTTPLQTLKKLDPNQVKSSNFEIVERVEGECLLTRKTADVMAFAKSVLKNLR